MATYFPFKYTVAIAGYGKIYCRLLSLQAVLTSRSRDYHVPYHQIVYKQTNMETVNEKETYESVCKRLDDVVLEFFHTVGQLYHEQDRLETFMKNGFLNMSRARYSMGLKSVGIEQCDENKMRAQVKISVSDDNIMSQYNGACDIDFESKFGDLDLGDGDKSGSNVRKRPKGNQEGDSHVQDVELNDIKKGDIKKLYDPLKWFGVLVPPALRQSQVDFKTSTETVVTVANLRIKLDTLQKEYVDLKQKKKELE